jgi:hypothetical protein
LGRSLGCDRQSCGSAYGIAHQDDRLVGELRDELL